MPDQDDASALSPSRPVALYEGPPITAFRGWGLVGLVVACVGAGASLHALWPRLEARLWPPQPTPAPLALPRGVGPSVLRGPSATVALPPSEPTVVNVWLQGCADCMTAFQAWRDLRRAGALTSVPLVNVAYGQADLSWAAQYAVDETLVFDDGAALVRPLGISTFTTLVMDSRGRVVHVDSPTRAGFMDRVQGAIGAASVVDRYGAVSSLSGEWHGEYMCAQGLTAVELTLRPSEDAARVLATFSFSPLASNPSAATGRFRMTGHYDPLARHLTLTASPADWLDRPADYVTVDLDGFVDDAADVLRGTVRGPGCRDFLVSKRGP